MHYFKRIDHGRRLGSDDLAEVVVKGSSARHPAGLRIRDPDYPPSSSSEPFGSV